MSLHLRAGKLALLLGATALIASLVGCSQQPSAKAPTTKSADAALTTIRLIDVSPGIKTKIAQGEGYFTKYGLKVELQNLAAGTAVLAAIQGGSGDIGYADLFAGVNANANGFNLRLVGINNTHPTAMPVLVKADSGIGKPTDLAGKTLGISPIPQQTVTAIAYLKNNGVNPSSVKLVKLTGSPGAESLQSGAVDAILSDYSTAYNNQGRSGEYDFKILGDPSTASFANPKATTAGFWSTKAWADANTATLVKFDKAWKAFNTHLLGLDDAQYAAVQKQYGGLDFTAIAADKTQLGNLVKVRFTELTRYDAKATQQWYDRGYSFAPDQIAKGVEVDDYVYSTVKKVFG